MAERTSRSGTDDGAADSTYVPPGTGTVGAPSSTVAVAQRALNARSRSYASVAAIPKSVVKFIESTG